MGWGQIPDWPDDICHIASLHDLCDLRHDVVEPGSARHLARFDDPDTKPQVDNALRAESPRLLAYQ